MKKVILILVTMFFLNTGITIAQPVINWTFNSPFIGINGSNANDTSTWWDWIMAMNQTSDSNYIAAGWSGFGASIEKFDRNGNVVFEQTYPYANGFFYGVTEDLSGYYYSISSGNLFFKFDPSNGDTIFTNQLGSLPDTFPNLASGNYFSSNEIKYYNTGTDSGFIIIGTQFTNPKPFAPFVKYSGPASDYTQGLVLINTDMNGHLKSSFGAGGYKVYNPSNDIDYRGTGGQNGYIGALSLIDSAGHVSGFAAVGSCLHVPFSIYADSFAVHGYYYWDTLNHGHGNPDPLKYISETDTVNDRDVYVVRTHIDGSVKWSNTFDKTVYGFNDSSSYHSKAEFGAGLLQLPSTGKLIVAAGFNSGTCLSLFRIKDTDGTLDSSYTPLTAMYSNGSDYWERAVLLDDESVVVAGNIYSGSYINVQLARVDSSGNRKWTHSYHTPLAYHNCIFGFARSWDQGGFICGGNSELGNDDYFVIELKTVISVANTITNASSCGGANGEIILSVSGGTTPYTYTWSPSVGTTATVSNLTAGAYNVTITDYDGFTKTEQVVVTEPFTHSSSVRLYGITGAGGTNNAGVLFHYDSPNRLTIDYNFTNEYILSNLVLGSYNKLYGSSGSGGANGCGYMFSYDLNNGLTDLYDFDCSSGWAGAWMQASDNLLYGYGGGEPYCDCGAIYSFDPSSNTFTDLYNNTGWNIIGFYGTLLQAINGKLYGVGEYGGNNGYGELFSFDPINRTLTDIYDFDSIHGDGPTGLFQSSTDSLLYGVTAAGGLNGDGVIFRFNPANNTYLDLYDCLRTNHKAYGLFGNLVQSANDSLYGASTRGGTYGYGNIFAFNISDSTAKNNHSFQYTNDVPSTSLLIASDGNIYGCSDSFLFKYIISSTIFTNEDTVLSGTPFGNGGTSNLIEVCIPPDIPTLSAYATTISHGSVDTLKVSSGNLNSASKWYWYTGSCGGTLVDSGISYTPTIPLGSTTYYVRGEGSCFSSCGCASIGISGTRVAGSNMETSISSFNVYPNPTSGEATIVFSSDTKESYTIRLIDVTEREVFSTIQTSVIGNNEYLMDLSNVPKGIYMVFLQKGNDIMKSQIVVQ